MIAKFIKGFILFCVIMLIIQIIVLIISFAMAMDGANHYSEQSNNMYGLLKYILGFPLYPIVNFDELIDSRVFRPELIFLFLGNSLIQYSVFRFLFMKNKID